MTINSNSHLVLGWVGLVGWLVGGRSDSVHKRFNPTVLKREELSFGINSGTSFLY